MTNRKRTNGQTIINKDTKLKIKDRATQIPLISAVNVGDP